MARRLTAAEKQQLAERDFWARYNAEREEMAISGSGARVVDPFEQELFDAAQRPSFSDVRTDTPTIEGRSSNPFLASVQEGNVASDAGRSLAAGAVDIGAGIIDALSPDPNALASDPTNPFQNAVENVVDTGLRMNTSIDTVLRGLAERLAPSAPPEAVDAVMRAVNPFGGMFRSAVEERQGRAGETIERTGLANEAADSMRAVAEGVRGGRSQAALAADEALGQAVDGGVGSLGRFLASGQGVRALTGVVAGSAPYAALGGGMGVLGRAAGLSQAASAYSAGATTFAAVASNNAAQAESAILDLDDASAMALPSVAELMAGGMDLQQAKQRVAASARFDTVAAMAPSAPLYAMGVFERVGSGIHTGNVLSTLRARVAAGVGREAATEAVQEGSERLASNVAQVGSGQRASGDMFEGVAASGVLGAVASGPLAAGASYADARGDFNTRADELLAIARQAETSAQARAGVATQRAAAQEELAQAQFEEQAMERLAADDAAREFVSAPFLPGAGTTDSNAGRPVEPFEQYAAREAAEFTAAEEAQRAFLGMNTLESSNAALEISLRGTPRQRPQELLGSPAARRAENRRFAAGAAADQQAYNEEQLAQAAFEDQTMGRLAAAEAANAEAVALDNAATSKERAANKSRTAAQRRAHLEKVRKANANLPTEQRVAAIAQAAQDWDTAQAQPAATPAPEAAPVAPQARPVPTRAPVSPEVDPEVLAELGLAQEDISIEPTPVSLDEREAALRARAFRADDSVAGPAQGRTSADVITELASRVRKGNSSEALAQEQLIKNGKLSVLDADQMAKIAPEAPNARGYYDGERMYINAARIPEGNASGAVLQEILAHEADHAARLSGNTEVKSRVRTMLGDGQTSKLLEQLRTSGHRDAVAARDMVASVGVDENTDPLRYEDELTAYAVTSAVRNAAADGSVWAPIRGLMSAARRKFKQYTGSDSINLEDLAGYAQDVIDALATSNQDIQLAPQRGQAAGRADNVQGPYAGELSRILNEEPSSRAEDLMAVVAQDNTLPEYERRLAERLAPLMSQFKVKVAPAAESEMMTNSDDVAGVYHAGTNTLHLRHADSVTVLHEGLHAVTRNLLAQRRVGKEDARLRALRGDFDDMLEHLRGAVAMGEVPNVPRQTLDMLTSKGGPLENTWELLSYGMTEPDIQALLAQMPAPSRAKAPNMWQWFKEAITRYFGTTDEERSFLDQLIESTGALVEYANTNPGVVRDAQVDAARMYQEATGRADASADAPRAISPQSVVRDANGEPLTVYHGTSNPFDVFDSTRGGSVTGAASARQGLFFTDRRKTAEYYSKADSTTAATRRVDEALAKARGEQPRGFGPRVIEANLDITNPLVHDFKGKVYREQTYNDLITKAKSEGRDGVILRNTFDAGEGSRLGVLFSGRVSPETIYVAFSPEQVVPVQAARRADASEDSTPLPSHKFATNKFQSAVKDGAKNAATWYGAEGKKAALLIEQSEGLLNSYYSHALSFSNRVTRGIQLEGKKLAKKEGISRKEAEAKVSAMLERRMGLIRKLPTQAARDKALSNLVAEYPNLVPVKEGVEAINAFTKQLVAERMADPTPLTEEEINTYEFMARNQSAYLTNTYALFQGTAGKEYAARLASMAQRGYDALAQGKELPAAVREEFAVYDRALKFVIANDVAVTDPSQLAAMSMDDVVNLHDLWAPLGQKASDLRTRMQNAGTYAQETFKDVLSDRVIDWVGQASREEIDALGKVVVNTLLRLNEMSGPAKRYAKAAGVDTSILQHLQGVPEPIAELYGRITDVPTLLLTTVTEMGELAARSELFNSIRNQGYGDLVVTLRDKAQDPDKYSGFTVPLSGESFGPLRGLYTTEAMARALGEYNEGFTTMLENIVDLGDVGRNAGTVMQAIDASGKVLAKANSLYKAMAIPTRVDYLFINALGSLTTPLLQGGVHPVHLVTGFKVAAKAVMNTLDPGGKWHDASIDFDSNLAAAMGVMENVVLQDIRQQPRKLVQAFIDDIGNADTTKDISKAFAKAKSVGGSAWQAWLEAFSMSDAWVRYPVAKQRMDFLAAYYKANGETVNNQRLMNEAAAYAKDVTMTAARSPGVIRGLERRGLTMYGNYLFNVPRVIYMNAKAIFDSFKMARDATTPEAASIAMADGLRKTIGFTTTMALLTYGIKTLADSLMDDEDREQLARDRVFLTAPSGELSENQYADLAYIGKDEQGNRMYINLSRVDAHGPVTDIFRAARSGATPMKQAQLAGEAAFGLMIESAVLGQFTKIAAKAFSDEDIQARPSRIDKMMPELSAQAKNAVAEVLPAESAYQWAELLLETAGMFVPAGIANRFEGISPSVAEASSESMATTAAMLEALGHKFVTVRPDAATKGAAFDLKDSRREGNRQIRDAITNIGPEGALETFVRVAQDERRAVQRVGEMYHALISSGVSPREAKALLADTGLDSRTIGNIDKRNYGLESEDWIRKHSSLLSTNVITSPPDKLRTPEERKAWVKQAKEVKKRVKIMGYDSEDNN